MSKTIQLEVSSQQSDVGPLLNFFRFKVVRAALSLTCTLSLLQVPAVTVMGTVQQAPSTPM
jgi:hypothetical protein